MRHRKKYSRLGLTTNQRKALLKGLAVSLLEHGAIVTTKARAKQLRPYVERLITKVKKEDESFARRLVFKKLQSKMAVKKLFDEYKEEFVNRPGGYTRIHLLGNRPGDAAEMARISLVFKADAAEEAAPETKPSEKKTQKSSKKETDVKAADKPVEAKTAETETSVSTEKPEKPEKKAKKPSEKAEAAESEANAE
ncbi:MAG: 50S ribosomal protein L17 [Acidobacteria bacterium]|nr:50S ribosomal protein L17 [Acidobacteriota bacterium]